MTDKKTPAVVAKQLGVENLSIFLAYVVDLGIAGDVIFEDGQVSVGDVGALWDMGKHMLSLGHIDFAQVFPEFEDITAEEMGHLVNMMKERFDLPDDQLEAKVEVFMDIGARIYLAIKDAITAVNHVRGL